MLECYGPVQLVRISVVYCEMKELKFGLKFLLCVEALLLCTLRTALSVEIKCIAIRSCPLIMQMLATKKPTPETTEFLKFSHCGYDEWKQPMVWCSMLDFCKTPDDRNGTCTPVKKCKPFLELTATLNILDPQIQNYLDQFRCNRVLEGIHVCCPTRPPFSFNFGDFKKPPERNFYKNPIMTDRFDYDYDYGDDYGMVADEPDTFHHSDSHGFGDFHKNMHGIDTDRRSWHNHYDSRNSDDSYYHHYHNYEHGNHKNSPDDRFHNHHSINRNSDEDNYNHNHKNKVSSGEKTGHKDCASNNNDKRGTDDHSLHETTERLNHGSHDRTTEESRWSTREPTTTARNKHNGNFGHTTVRPSSSTPKRQKPTDDDGIIFLDSMEDYTTSKSSTRSTTTTRSQTDRNVDGKQNVCETPDRKTGFCVKENTCERYLKLKRTLDKSKESTKTYLSKFKCNSNSGRETFICCQKDEENAIDNSVVNHERTNENVPEPYSKICGRQRDNSNKIFGGSFADLGEFPWMALLRYPTSKGMQFGCGGTLISNRHVLTAAHCVDEEILKSKGLGKLSQVILGEYDTRNKTDCVYMEYGEDCADPPKTIGVDSIISHRSYSSETTRNDIALIRLNQDVKFTDFIKPICLPTKTSTVNGNETFVIAGWGRTPTEPFSPILKKAKIPYVRKENCNSRSPANRQLIEGQICAGLGNGTDSCNGDSGGPLMLNVNFNFEIVAHIVGIISYGFGRCVSGPSVNTYVPYYIDWIKENMK